MHGFRVHTLVDITDNGNLQRSFPFKTKSDITVHNKETLAVARNQNNNFNTLLQLLQIRGNIIWEIPPKKYNTLLGNTKFGTVYEGKQNTWTFQFFTEQSELYGDFNNPTGQLIEDFNLVPVITDCEDTANFPIKTFITRNLEKPSTNMATQEQKVINAIYGDIINTYFSYAGETNK